ncbi:MAG: DUF3877 family protein [Roseburia sp.]
MTLEKHIVDTMKEWQMKIGSLDSNMRLYYPKNSLCGYLDLESEIGNDALKEYIKNYLSNHASYLGEITISYEQDRFCFLVRKQGCDYVEQNVPEPEFLGKFLKVLKMQNMKEIIGLFQEYAKQHGTKVGSRKEDNGLGTVLYFEDENVEPYVYCIEENEFGVTYHRFVKSDVPDLQ